MKMLAEYLEKAITFERMAAQEKDGVLRASLEKQAMAYRKLAADRANRLKPQEPHNQAESVPLASPEMTLPLRVSMQSWRGGLRPTD